jgi:uncharacterized membrane protein
MNPLTGVLAEAWGLYRRFAAHFLTIAFVLYFLTAVIVTILVQTAGAAGYFVASVVEFVATFLVQAAMIKAVRDGRADLSMDATISAAARYLLPVVGAAILAGIGIGIGLALLIVPGLILMTYWSLIVPSIVIGESGVMASFGKSWRAISGHFRQAFGTYVLVFLIWVAFDIALGLALVSVPGALRSFLSSVIGGTLLAPFYALVLTLVYYRLSEAREGAVPAAPSRGGFTEPPPAQA